MVLLVIILAVACVSLFSTSIWLYRLTQQGLQNDYFSQLKIKNNNNQQNCSGMFQLYRGRQYSRLKEQLPQFNSTTEVAHQHEPHGQSPNQGNVWPTSTAVGTHLAKVFKGLKLTKTQAPTSFQSIDSNTLVKIDQLSDVVSSGSARCPPEKLEDGRLNDATSTIQHAQRNNPFAFNPLFISGLTPGRNENCESIQSKPGTETRLPVSVMQLVSRNMPDFVCSLHSRYTSLTNTQTQNLNDQVIEMGKHQLDLTLKSESKVAVSNESGSGPLLGNCTTQNPEPPRFYNPAAIHFSLSARTDNSCHAGTQRTSVANWHMVDAQPDISNQNSDVESSHSNCDAQLDKRPQRPGDYQTNSLNGQMDIAHYPFCDKQWDDECGYGKVPDMFLGGIPPNVMHGDLGSPVQLTEPAMHTRLPRQQSINSKKATARCTSSSSDQSIEAWVSARVSTEKQFIDGGSTGHNCRQENAKQSPTVLRPRVRQGAYKPLSNVQDIQSNISTRQSEKLATQASSSCVPGSHSPGPVSGNSAFGEDTVLGHSYRQISGPTTSLSSGQSVSRLNQCNIPANCPLACSDRNELSENNQITLQNHQSETLSIAHYERQRDVKSELRKQSVIDTECSAELAFAQCIEGNHIASLGQKRIARQYNKQNDTNAADSYNQSNQVNHVQHFSSQKRGLVEKHPLHSLQKPPKMPSDRRHTFGNDQSYHEPSNQSQVVQTQASESHTKNEGSVKQLVKHLESQNSISSFSQIRIKEGYAMDDKWCTLAREPAQHMASSDMYASTSGDSGTGTQQEWYGGVSCKITGQSYDQ